jgi:predicted component of type VI protein secretion system
MAKLILSLDGMVLREFPLSKERTTIGRKSHNDVVIDNLAVSGEHAMIMTILNDSFLEDLGSTNGTLVNGQPIKKHFLQNNDVIELGKYKIKYHSEVVIAQPAQQDFEKTMVLRAPPLGAAAAPPAAANAAAAAATPAPAAGAPAPKSLRDTVVDPAQADSLVSTDVGGQAQPAVQSQPTAQPQPAVVAAAAVSPAPKPAAAMAPSTVMATAAALAGGSAAVAMPAPAVQAPVAAPAEAPATVGVIQILSGPSAGKELPLIKPLTTLGKPGVQVAVIARRPQGYFITHVEGSHFPVVNGKGLDAQAQGLSDHDVIELAGVKMEFFLKPNA